MLDESTIAKPRTKKQQKGKSLRGKPRKEKKKDLKAAPSKT